MKSNKDKFEWTDEKVKEFYEQFWNIDLDTSIKEFKAKHSQPKCPEGIVKFRAIKGALAETYYTLHKEDYQTWVSRLIKDGQEIYTVKNSKEEEFSVGDKIGNPGYVTPIESWRIFPDGELLAMFDNNSHGLRIDLLQKAKTPLFTTEDGFEIFMDDYVSFVITSIHPWEIRHQKVTSEVFAGAWKRFKERGNAEAWIEKNKPKYSEQQIRDAAKWANDNSTKTAYELSDFLEKLGIKCT